MSLFLKLLGETRLLSESQTVTGRAVQKRRVGLLALLSCTAKSGISRDKILGLLWPEMSTDQGRKLLSEAVYVIRKELGQEIILTINDDLKVNAAVLQSDVQQFRNFCANGQLDRAIAAYSGPFMDGWFLADCAEFEHWVETERDRLTREYTGVLNKAADIAESSGDIARAIEYRNRLIELDPLSSTQTVRLARLLATHGERGPALRLVAEHARLMESEVGARPDQAMVDLSHELRIGGADQPTPNAAALTSVVSAPVEKTAGARETMAAPSPVKSSRGLVRYATMSLAILAAAGALAWRAISTATPVNALDRNRIAVLYLRDGSIEQDLGPIADGLTDAIIGSLSSVNAFEVVSSNGTKRFRGQPVGVDSVARALHAGSIVDGTVQRSGDRLLVTVRLSDGESGAVLSSSSMERSMQELFVLQRSVAQDVAAAIRQRLGRDVRLREMTGGSENVRATQLVLRADRERDDAVRLIANGNLSALASARKGLRRADSLFAEAALEDRQWLRPLLGRGHTALQLASMLEGDERASTLSNALRLADSAIHLDSLAPAALELRGMIRWGIIHARAVSALDRPSVSLAAQDLEAAVARDSTLARSWATLTNLYWITGDAERAYHAGERALASDAYLEESPRIVLQMFFSSIERGSIPDARRWCDLGRLTYASDYRFTLCALTLLKYDVTSAPDPTRAWSLVARLDTLDPEPTARNSGHAYTPVYRRLVAAAVSARAGDKALARAELARAKLSAAGDASMLLDIASDEVNILMLIGRSSEANAVLARLIAARPLMDSLSRIDPILSKVRVIGSAPSR